MLTTCIIKEAYLLDVVDDSSDQFVYGTVAVDTKKRYEPAFWIATSLDKKLVSQRD